MLGFLDGQTTNPTLVAHHPEAKARLARGERFSEEEIYDFYRQVVTEMSGFLPDGSISIEVYADEGTKHEQMCRQSLEMYRWIPNAQIKYPITGESLPCIPGIIHDGGRVNMTLCFTQAQAAAVHAVASAGQPEQAFVSPFVGRLDDIGVNGMDLIANCVRMYRQVESPVQVLAASLRNLDHFMASLSLGADIITAPLSILKAWADAGRPLPGDEFKYDAGALKPIPYEDLDLDQPWDSFNVKHPLTDKGIAGFAADWNELIEK